MDEKADLNQGQTKTLSDLEKELEEIKGRVKIEYRNKQTTSPIRTTAPDLQVDSKKIETRPTYLEEGQLAQTTKLEQEEKVQDNVSRATQLQSGKSKIIFWIGMILLVLALIIAGVYLALQLR